ncbi:Transcription elongation factor Elf1 like [Geosmithia morbida]|uniref:Transcription elongation factor 1 homolog n=1 Tax=Geosmithia morbida TaxID=1094350 RepID=A0A9P4YQU9_9HYPO|nr:Transcription elongation factor Elf1 like [Geosmithia morbida]KAF4120127.1 Transcription elongation factor Elf1 like [Geosmithia morbida]
MRTHTAFRRMSWILSVSVNHHATTTFCANNVSRINRHRVLEKRLYKHNGEAQEVVTWSPRAQEDKKAGVGQLDCRICGQKFQCAVNSAVDVYGEWVDAADAVAKEDEPTEGYSGTSRPSGSRRTLTSREDDDDDRQYQGDGIVGDDEAV